MMPNTPLTTELLQEFNAQQIRHVSVSSDGSTGRYAPNSPTPSIQEVTPLPLPRAKNVSENPQRYSPVSPAAAENALCKEGDNVPDAMRIIVHGLITTI